MISEPPAPPENTEAPISARRAAVRRLANTTPSHKRAQTQARLLKAGRALIADKGIGATSVGDICSAAGYTRGAFYSSFTDMDHFVRRLADDQWSRVLSFVDEAIDRIALPSRPVTMPSTEAELAEATRSLASQILMTLPLSREFFLLQFEFSAYITRDPERAPTLRQGYSTFKERVGAAVLGGLEAIGRECVLSPADTIELIFGAADRSMRLALQAPAPNEQKDSPQRQDAPEHPGSESGPGSGPGQEDQEDSVGGQGADPQLTELLDRTLPTLLANLSRPRSTP